MKPALFVEDPSPRVQVVGTHDHQPCTYGYYEGSQSISAWIAGSSIAKSKVYSRDEAVELLRLIPEEFTYYRNNRDRFGPISIEEIP